MPQTARKLDYYKEHDEHIAKVGKYPQKRGNVSTYDLDAKKMLEAERRKRALLQARKKQKEQNEKKEAALQPEKKPRSLKAALSSIFVILTICGIFSLVIARYMIIANNNTKINSLKGEIEQINSQIKYNEVQAELKSDLEEIKRVASEELHMDFPTNDQIVYIHLDQNIDDIEGTQLADSGED